MSTAVPVIVCGAMKEIAAQVHAQMLPEYDVVYAGYSLAATAKEVPQILSGSPPPPSRLHTQIGSNDFAGRPPRAVITGGGYSNEAFQTLLEACAQACGSEADLPVPFFRADNALTDRLAAEAKGPAHSAPEYPRAIAERLKAKLRETGVGSSTGAENAGNGGQVFFF